MRIVCILCILCITACSTVTTVNNCPAWIEAGTIDIPKDTEITKRWMYRYEKNRVRECENKK